MIPSCKCSEFCICVALICVWEAESLGAKPWLDPTGEDSKTSFPMKDLKGRQKGQIDDLKLDPDFSLVKKRGRKSGRQAETTARDISITVQKNTGEVKSGWLLEEEGYVVYWAQLTSSITGYYCATNLNENDHSHYTYCANPVALRKTLTRVTSPAKAHLAVRCMREKNTVLRWRAHSVPRRNIPQMADFCRKDSFNVQTAGKGMARMTRSVTTPLMAKAL